MLRLTAEEHDNTTIARLPLITEHSLSKHIGDVFLELDLPRGDLGHRWVPAVPAHLQHTWRARARSGEPTAEGA